MPFLLVKVTKLNKGAVKRINVKSSCHSTWHDLVTSPYVNFLTYIEVCFDLYRARHLPIVFKSHGEQKDRIGHLMKQLSLFKHCEGNEATHAMLEKAGSLAACALVH